MKWTIYCHTHITSGRRYVGLTSQTMMQRWNKHVHKSRSKTRGYGHFPNAIRLYGKESFSHEVLEVCETVEQANEAEERWIAHFDTRNPEKGFNIARGRHVPHPVLRNPWERATYRAKSLPALLKRNTDPVVRAAISAKLTGRKLSPEHAQKVREIVAPRQKALSVAGNAARRGNPKTHCKHGHSLHDAYVGSDRKRKCRTCDRQRCLARNQDPSFKEKQSRYNKDYHRGRS